MSDASILRQIQAEQRPWVAHNFGDRPSWMPLLGLVEEAGELAEADSERDLNGISDALSDIMIFALDYCSAMGWDAGDIWLSTAKVPNAGFIGMLKTLGKLAHAHLKDAQGIRVTEDHKAAGRKALGELFACLRAKDANLVERTLQTWQKVKKRDWKADPAKAIKPKPEPKPDPAFVPVTDLIPVAATAAVSASAPSPEPKAIEQPPQEDDEDTVEAFLGTLDLVQ